MSIDGRGYDVEPGRTVAAVLLELGRVSWRATRRGRPRGVFCGIGVCFDCLVDVNDTPDVRACQRVLADGDRVRTVPT
ncbi:(2Fe-2S)-binding protein [Pilimelia anulata]|uniref:(2Fe-2S)-binding protein n=1 Tax=Pilimelia anulata TaxID=53371 RepID=UPI001E38B846|nr:(2Fe-2S)-binding protein [Pilimelia anulata]